MPFSMWSRFLQRRRMETRAGGFPARWSSPRPRNVLLNLECLEERALLSGGPGGGPGPSGGSGSSGSSGGPGPSALISQPTTSGQQGPSPGSSGSNSGASGSGSGVFAGTITIGAPLPAPGPYGILLQDLFSGYPLPPSTAPSLQGDVLVLTNPASWPFSTPQSTVSVVPVLLTGVSVSPIPGSTSQNVNL